MTPDVSESEDRPPEPDPTPPPEPQTSLEEQELPPEPREDRREDGQGRKGTGAADRHDSDTRP